MPKSVEAVRKTLLALPYEELTVSVNFHCYEHKCPQSTYSSQDWNAQVKLEKEEVQVFHQCHDGDTLIREIKKKLSAAIKAKAEQRRIAHQPKLLEYKPA